MNNDDDLRARLAAIDPERTAGSLHQGPPPTTEIRERIMQTISSEPGTAEGRGSRWWENSRLLVAAAVVGAAAVGGGAIWATAGGSAQPDAPSTLALTAPGGDPAMSMCLPFDVAILRDMPVAFGGTVNAIGPESVTLDVDRWYKGGTDDEVSIAVSGAAAQVALDGVEFVDGERYLVTATDGAVSVCGYSGPASAELEQAYAEAFGG